MVSVLLLSCGLAKRLESKAVFCTSDWKTGFTQLQGELYRYLFVFAGQQSRWKSILSASLPIQIVGNHWASTGG